MATPPDAPSPTPVTVLGLGAMGSAIARVLLDRGHATTVWNRTAGKADPLVEAGATAAATAAEAVAASPLVVLCVLDSDAVDDVLAGVGDAVAGRTLANLTSGSPDGARAVAAWALDHGAEYLDGGVMGDPPDLGSGHVALPLSGSRSAYEAHEATFAELGTPTYHGADAGHASVEFMAQVAVAYELLIGLLHALHLVQREGIDAGEFAARVAASLPAYPALVTAIGEAVRDGEYPPDLGPLSVQSALMGDLVDHRRSLGVDTVRMDEVKRLMEERVAAGHGAEGFSGLYALIDR
jgi:3-hydroxyisobutyrate dehydrogenase-like beta-hydroxyacid dehydrogenase